MVEHPYFGTYFVPKRQKVNFGKFNNFTYHWIDLLTLNKTFYLKINICKVTGGYNIYKPGGK